MRYSWRPLVARVLCFLPLLFGCAADSAQGWFSFSKPVAGPPAVVAAALGPPSAGGGSSYTLAWLIPAGLIVVALVLAVRRFFPLTSEIDP